MRTRTREVYAQRKAQRLCVDCGATLQPEDGLCCVEHAEIRRRAVAKYRQSAKGRKVDLAWKRRRYEERAAAGLCVQSGCAERAVPGHRRCEEHGVAHKVAQALYAIQREEGMTA